MAYAYDAWGRQVSCTGAMAATLGVENPFRYRGYIYDEETGWYYLMSRYYNPVWGRFVSVDIVLGKTGALLSHNTFAYCGNNPVNLYDPSGMTPQWQSPEYIAAMEAHGRRLLAALAQKNNTVEQLSSRKIIDKGMKAQTVTLTDLETGRSFDIHWNPPYQKENGTYYHSDFAILNEANRLIIEEIQGVEAGGRFPYDFGGRKGIITFNSGLVLAVGFHLNPHDGGAGGGIELPGYIAEKGPDGKQIKPRNLLETTGHFCAYYGDNAGGTPDLNNVADATFGLF